MEALLFVLLLPYLTLILYFSIKLYVPKQYPQEDVIDTECSMAVIVACKNETDTLPALLASLKSQHSMPKEIIFVDDNSTDDTYGMLQSFAQKMPNVKVFKNPGHGKKAALIEGVTHSSCKYMLFTDADCTIPEEFCLNAKIFLSTHKADMLLGGVKLDYGNNGNNGNNDNNGNIIIYNPLQAFEILDFCSLQAVTAGSAMAGTPVMCNGANMIVRRDIYLQNISGIRTDIPSGDDMFMLHNIKASGGRICYLLSPKQIISTQGNPNVRSFFRQRKRWIGKLPAYTDRFTIITAAITAVTNVMMAALYLSALFSPRMLDLCLIAYLLKLVADCFVIIPYLRIINRRNLLYYMPLMSIFYPFYVTVTGFIAVLSFVVKSNKNIVAQQNNYS